MHRRTPTGTRTPDLQPHALDDAGGVLSLLGSAAIGILAGVTAAQWILDVIAWDRLISFAIGAAFMLFMISAFLGIAAVICSRPPTANNR